MIGAGTKDLANGVAQVATHFTESGDGQGVWILDGDGSLLASGGNSAADGLLEFAVHGDQLDIHGLRHDRVAIRKLVRPTEQVTLWVVLTASRGRGEARIADFAEGLARLMERTGLREYETEDTTEHLLSCFEQIRAVHDLADKLPACSTVEEMGRLCLESLLLALGVRLGALVLGPDGLEPPKALIMGEEGASEWSTEVPIDGEHAGGPLAKAFADGKVRYGPVKQFEIQAGSLEAQAQDWLLVVPICFGSEESLAVLGCLVLLDRGGDEEGAPFGSPEAELTQSVSVLLGLVLGTRLRVEAEKELQMARQIQETLVPDEAPSWSGVDLAGRNRAANQVGGDYFDYLESDSGHRHVVIADVSGHNMASAMAMAMARSQLQAVLARDSAPKEVLGQLARGLFQDLVRNELFITCFLLSIVEQSGDGTRIRYTNAGHNPPLLLRSDGRVEWMDGGGPMVGFLPAVDYEEQELELGAGDLVVLYTDGVTEATNSDGEMLDEPGLAEIVKDLASGSAESILAGIFRAVDGHASSGQHEDDVTVVVIKISEADGRGDGA